MISLPETKFDNPAFRQRMESKQYTVAMTNMFEPNSVIHRIPAQYSNLRLMNRTLRLPATNTVSQQWHATSYQVSIGNDVQRFPVSRINNLSTPLNIFTLTRVRAEPSLNMDPKHSVELTLYEDPEYIATTPLIMSGTSNGSESFRRIQRIQSRRSCFCQGLVYDLRPLQHRAGKPGSDTETGCE